MSVRNIRRVSSLPLLICLMIGAAAMIGACAAPGSTSSVAAPASASTAASVRGMTGAAATSVAPESVAGTSAPALPECASGALKTLTPGTLTIGTASPGADPWYVGGSPSSGEGLESAVAYGVAEALGYSRDRVTWAEVDRAKAAAGADVGFDFDLNQFTAPDAGTVTADYSTGYFAVTDTLVMRRAAAPLPTSVAGIKALTIGAVPGSSSASAVQRVAGKDPIGFADEHLALAALSAGSVQGVVLPTPAAFTAVAADPTLAPVGQLPTDPDRQPEQFKALLPKGSELTGCVSAAVDRLRVEGTLEALAHQWVDPQVPELR